MRVAVDQPAGMHEDPCGSGLGPEGQRRKQQEQEWVAEMAMSSQRWHTDETSMTMGGERGWHAARGSDHLWGDDPPLLPNSKPHRHGLPWCRTLAPSWRALLGVILLLAASPADAQAPARPVYHPAQLDCSRYRQQVRSVILLDGGGQHSRETTGRDGTLSIHATSADSALRLEAWFDTLTVWREGSGERLEPETDGVIGGRFRGTLTRAGGFTETDRPFIPDEIAQVADVGDALAELWPPLPAAALLPGAAWKDEFGTVILRIPDGTRDGRRVERYRINRKLEREETRLLSDSSEVRAERSETEASVLEWSGELGPVRWDREVTVLVTVPTGGPVRQPFRTRIEQQISIERLAGSCRAGAD